MAQIVKRLVIRRTVEDRIANSERGVRLASLFVVFTTVVAIPTAALAGRANSGRIQSSSSVSAFAGSGGASVQSTKTRVVYTASQKPATPEARSYNRVRCVAKPTRASWTVDEGHIFPKELNGKILDGPWRATYRYTEVRCNGGAPYTIARCIGGDCPPGAIGTPTGPPPPVLPDARVLAAAAMANVDYRFPRAVLSPPQTPSAPVVGMPTFFAVDNVAMETLTETASECDQDLCTSVAVTAVPTELTVDTGAGIALEDCPLPGVVVRNASQAESANDACAFVYQSDGTYSVTLRLHYVVSWSSDTGLADTEDRTTETTYQLTVKEFQPVLVSPRIR